MYSIITKIIHSQQIKDSIAVARGLYRVAAGHQSDHATQGWTQPNRTHPISQQSTQKTQQFTQTKIQSAAPVLQKQVESTPQPNPIQPTHVSPDIKEQQPAPQNSQIPNLIADIKEEISLGWDGALAGQQRKESGVIASRFGRFLEYGKLGKQMLSMQVQAYFAKNLGTGNEQDVYERGAQRITEQLCKMRGAPLKVAQMLSIQEDNLIPAPIRKAFEKARQQAHVMSEKDVQTALTTSLGKEWRSRFGNFEMNPFAAASIGQVHRATALEGTELAVKLQYPGVERSIHSDIKNLKLLLKLPGVLPKGIFIDKLLANTEKELREECDYERQAKMQSLYNRCIQQVMGGEFQRFGIAAVAATLSNRTVLTSEFLRGVGLSKFEEGNIPQAVRDEVGRLLMKLTFSEIFEMGIMQSDPNPSNFTYNLKDRRLNLFDFGATHIYPKQFLEHYSNIIHASVRQDNQSIVEHSILAGFLTNEQNKVMLEKHIESILVLGEPLRQVGIYDFGSQKITERIYRTIPQMLKNRLKSPPQEVYSLHRKLSGAYLACIRMRSRVDCHSIYEQLNPGYKIQALL